MQASGDYLIMLNNDTHVTPGWIATLTRHFQRSAELGLLGPVTNNIGNEARIDIRYDTMDEMRTAAAEFTTRHAGQRTPLCTAAFFCVMLRRSVYEKVGPLDEAFGIGFFEDDDYCRRVEQAGWTIACADDVFVHHQLSASFDKMKQETRQALFEKNRAIYESKWGAWVPHKYRDA
jgi:GT2 family glycosyltransferase